MGRSLATGLHVIPIILIWMSEYLLYIGFELKKMFSSNKFKANIIKQGVFHTQTIVSFTLHWLSVADWARADELTSYMFKVD